MKQMDATARVFSVGDFYPLWRPEIKGLCGATLHRDSGGGLLIEAFLDQMSEGDARMLRKTRMEFRMSMNVEEQFLFTAVKLKSDKKSTPDLVFELEHDPSLYTETEQREQADALRNINIMSLYGVDSSTGILQAIRVFTAPVAWLEVARSCWTGHYSNRYSDRYRIWLEAVRAGQTDRQGYCPFPSRPASASELPVGQVFSGMKDAGYSGNQPQFFGK